MLRTSQLEGFNTIPPIRHLRVSGQVRHHPQTSPVLLPTHLPLPFPPPEASPPFPSPHFCGFSNLILVSPHTSGRKNSPLFSAVQTDSYLPNLTLTPPTHPVLSTYHPTDQRVGGEKNPTQRVLGKEEEKRAVPVPCRLLPEGLLLLLLLPAMQPCPADCRVTLRERRRRSAGTTRSAPCWGHQCCFLRAPCPAETLGAVPLWLTKLGMGSGLWIWIGTGTEHVCAEPSRCAFPPSLPSSPVAAGVARM